MKNDPGKGRTLGGILPSGIVAAAFLHCAFAGTGTCKTNDTGGRCDFGGREGDVSLRLSDACGAVDSLIAADGAARVVPAAEAFTLQLLDGRGEPMRLKSSDFVFETAGTGLTWRHQNGLTVRMEVTATGGEFRFKPSVENIPAGMLLEWFDGPQIHVAADSTLFWPYVDGVEVTDVTRRGSPYRPVGFRDRSWHGIYSLYPSYCQMQFLAAYKNGKGVYFSAVDERHTPKCVDWERIGDEAVRLSLLTFCGDLTDGAWRPSFHYVLRPCDGGWMDACEIYRDWVRTLPAFASPPKRPKWMYDSPVNLIYPVRGEGLDNLPRDMPANCYFPYMNAMSAVEKYGKLLDSRIMALLMHWEGTAPWAPPYVWPPYGGEGELAKFRDALHARGDLLGVYCSGTAWTQASCIVPSYSLEQRFEDEHLGRHMARGPKGEITAGCCNGPDAQRFGCEMCLADEWSMRTVADEVAKMSRFGIDYCQFFDQNNGGGWHLCYAKNHGHPPIPGAWEVDAMVSLQKKVTASAAHDGMLLGCEASAATPYVPQLFYNDVRFAWAFWKCGIGGARPVHGSAFVFHEWACNFSGNQCASRDIDPFYRWSYAFHNGDMLSLVLGRDNGLAMGWGRSWDEEFSEQSALVSLVRRLNALRRKHPSFLLEGRMVKPPFKCESRRTKLSVRADNHEFSPEVPEVLVSFWENAEGKRIGFATNWRREPSDLRITRDDGHAATRRLAQLETIELQADDNFACGCHDAYRRAIVLEQGRRNP